MSVEVRAIGRGVGSARELADAANWELLREVRLAALLDSPAAFLSTHAETAVKPSDYWQAWPYDGQGFVAFLRGQPVGMVGVATNPEGYADLFAMWVAPEARGSGAADALLEAAVAWTAGQGLTEVRLEVAAGNERAARVYARHGFADTDEPSSCTGGKTMRFRVVTAPAPR